MVAFNGRSLRVLVVEDNAQFRLLIRTVLKALGIRQIVEAADGGEGLAQLSGCQPDLVITDWKMAPMDGLELTRRLRSDDESPNPFVPIIMISGYADGRLLGAARDAGVNEFMAKPISARVLMSRVVTVLQTPRAFIRVSTYFGPDRRRRHMSHGSDERRRGQKGLVTPEFSATP